MEGVEKVDVEASSDPRWKKFFESLPVLEKFLDIFGSGAMRSQTRTGPDKTCALCGAPRPSAQHLWGECSGMEEQR